MDAVILLAHGARSERWAQPFEAIRDLLVARQPGLPVSLAFLELMQPDFGAACDRLAAAGAARIVVCPLFLGVGGHVARDIPLLIEAARERWPAVTIHATPTLGENCGLLHAIADACEQHLGVAPPRADPG